MTWFRRTKATRAGSVLSASNATHLAAAHAHLQAVFKDAGVDPDDLAGEDGTVGVPDMAAGQLVAPDGTGVRVSGAPTGPTVRMLNGATAEVRG